MEVRDAVEADAERLASLTEAPCDVMRNLVHDRTVRVAEDGEEIAAFVSFDARADTVHVTQLEGDPDAFDPLLAEPVAFARTEDMAVELLVPAEEESLEEAAIEAGFSLVGSGPSFGGEPTTRYRLEPGAAD
ncbi:MAG: hypothetical protein V5A43_03920 [Haloarculaceae archaeon]